MFAFFFQKRINKLYNLFIDKQAQLSLQQIIPEKKFIDIEGQLEEYSAQKKAQIQMLLQREGFQKEFIGNLAHELKTPTFNIQGYLLTLLEGGINDPSINLKYLQGAEKSLNRMIQILEDLDAISKFDSDRIELSLKPCLLLDLLEEIQEELHMKFKNNNTLFELEIPENIVVLADKKRIKQVFINLINNAIKYGKPNGKIRIDTTMVNHKVAVRVSDNGLGMASKHLERIFERFYRVEESRSRHLGGSGLGLAIVKSIIEQHGEQISVQSEVGLGTTFTFTLKKA